MTSEGSPDFGTSAECLDQAVDGLRRAGTENHVPRGLLARAALRRLAGQLDAAAADLREAEEIAERGHMLLHLADVHLERTQLCWQRGEAEAARQRLERAKELVASTGYGRREREVAWLEGF